MTESIQNAWTQVSSLSWSWLADFSWFLHVLLALFLIWIFVSILVSGFKRLGTQSGAARPTLLQGPWKNTLALTVVGGSFIILTILVFFSFIYVQNFITADNSGFNDEFAQYSVQIIGVILPVVGTWVGTVLAFYFARQNFEAAEQAFLRPGRKPSRPVSDFMLPIDALARFDNFDANKEMSTDIKTIREIIKSKTVPRALFLDKDGNTMYILHGNTIDRALASKLKDSSGNEISESTNLQEFLDNVDFDIEATGIQKFRELAGLFRSISRDGTLLECKKMFDADRMLENILVTDTGEKDKEKPLGLITRERLGAAVAEMSEATDGRTT